MEVKIPEEFDSIYEEYNNLQKRREWILRNTREKM